MDSSDEPTVPDTGMASGSDAGSPGEQTDARPLDDEERDLLRDLERRQGQEVVGRADEDSPAAARAAADDAPLPEE